MKFIISGTGVILGLCIAVQGSPANPLANVMSKLSDPVKKAALPPTIAC
jgi:hypothetical protein